MNSHREQAVAPNPFVLAVVPARGGSKGLPRKNVLPLAGRPLITHTIDAAAGAATIDQVLVNTDDDEIAAVADASRCQVVRRPDSMGSDLAKVDPLLIWSVETFELTHNQRVDVVVLLYPTAPLRRSESIDQTVRRVTEQGCDSALTLTEDTSYLWRIADDGTAAPTNYEPARRAPRQTEAWNQYRENKAVYVVGRDRLLHTKCRLGGRIGYVTMPPAESVDIDSAADLAVAEALLRGGRYRRAA